MPIDMDTLATRSNVLRAAEIVTTYVAHTNVPPDELPKLIAAVHAQLAALSQAIPASAAEPQAVAQKRSPAAIKRSITPDALISFIDGKPYKALKRHLTKHGLDARGYRERYGLPSDYPTTAPNFSAERSALAKKLGLGRSQAGSDKPGASRTPVLNLVL